MDNPEVANHIEATYIRLKRLNNFVRSLDISALGEIGNIFAVPTLIEALKDEDYNIRRNAIEALGEISDASAVPALSEALKDKNDHLRQLAASALGNIGDASAVPSLSEMLKEEGFFVRYSAASALGEIGDASAVPALIEALKEQDDNDLVIWRAAEALVKIGIPAVPSLIEVLVCKDTLLSIRRIAAKALGEIGDATAVPAIIEVLNLKTSEIHYEAIAALIKIGVPAIPALIEVNLSQNAPATISEALSSVLWNSEIGSKTITQYAIEALEKMGDSVTLPRKILADSRFSAQERISIIGRLRGVRYKGGYPTIRYTFPDTYTLCRRVLKEKDAQARAGAQAVLDWLNGDRDLLHAYQRNTFTEQQELLRASQGGADKTQHDTMLRASGKPEGNVDPPVLQPPLWKRWFRKRTNDA